MTIASERIAVPAAERRFSPDWLGQVFSKSLLHVVVIDAFVTTRIVTA